MHLSSHYPSISLKAVKANLRWNICDMGWKWLVLIWETPSKFLQSFHGVYCVCAYPVSVFIIQTFLYLANAKLQIHFVSAALIALEMKSVKLIARGCIAQ